MKERKKNNEKEKERKRKLVSHFLTAADVTLTSITEFMAWSEHCRTRAVRVDSFSPPPS